MPTDDWFVNANDVYDYLMKQAIIDSQPRAIRRAARLVIEFPAADEEPKRHGRWVSKEGVYGVVYCSICDFELKIDNTPYCPNCGARMLPEKPKEEVV